MPNLLCYSGKVPKIRTCLYNLVAHCSEQILEEQHDFILQNDWELTYLMVFIIAICFFQKNLRLSRTRLARKHWRYFNENNCPLPEEFTQFRPATARGKVIKKCITKINKGLCISWNVLFTCFFLSLSIGYWYVSSSHCFPLPCVLAVVQVSDPQEINPHL